MTKVAVPSTAVSPRELPPLVVHVIFALGTGGLENGLVHIINRCPPERYRHAIVCLTAADDFARRIRVPNVRVIELHKREGHDLRVFWRLWRCLYQLRPAIVHTRNLAALETQILGLLFPRMRRIHGEHGRDVADLYGENPRYRMLRRALAPLIQRFICVSDDLATWLRLDVGIDERKVEQIYNGVDHVAFHRSTEPARVFLPKKFLPSAKKGLVVGTVGRLVNVKDQQLILRALSHIFDIRPELRSSIRCIIVGDGPLRGALEAQALNTGLADAVWFAGKTDDVPSMLACLDVFMLPSLAEGISNTILEAMAAGLPVVATRVGGNMELVAEGETGLLVPATDHHALARALLELYDNPMRMTSMGVAAMAVVRSRFDWGKTVQRYLQVYDTVLGRAPGASVELVARRQAGEG